MPNQPEEWFIDWCNERNLALRHIDGSAKHQDLYDLIAEASRRAKLEAWEEARQDCFNLMEHKDKWFPEKYRQEHWEFLRMMADRYEFKIQQYGKEE